MLTSNPVCLQAGPTGTEALKNLVLPGVGAFTVVDSGVVNEFDLANNFFTSQRFLGRSRAECVTELLGELNQDVQGTAHVRDPMEIIQKDLGFFLRFSLVIATQLDEHYLCLLGDICEKLGVALVVARTYGLMGAVRVYAKDHFCYNVNPYPAPDLRMYAAFPELQVLAQAHKEFNSHVPYVLVLCNEVNKWKLAHNGQLPSTREERELFKVQVKSLSLEGEGGLLEENLTEAIRVIYLAHGKPELRQETRELFANGKCDEMNLASENHWVLTRALRDFYYKHDEQLPVTGAIPDMTSTTQLFVQVQQCFNVKSKQDYDEFSLLVDKALELAGKPMDSLAQEERATYFKYNASQMNLCYRSPRLEFMSPMVDQVPWCDTELNPFVWYLVWRACDWMFHFTGQYPGSQPTATAEELELQAVQLHAKAVAMTLEHFAEFDSKLVSLNVCREMVRFGAVEMHNIAAVVGGIAAQEAVKLLTHQYEPLNHTYFFNGITAQGANWSL
ncbi:hypothetical protein BASA81_008590 [Batrachochytrium salamandrivorans]|nr:hypothetical protein BASA81_008590 [Batrachochytrium salamandrivorans]